MRYAENITHDVIIICVPIERGSVMLVSHCGEYPCECKKKYSPQCETSIISDYLVCPEFATIVCRYGCQLDVLGFFG